MKKVITIIECDLCGKENVLLQGISYPVYFLTEQTEGRPVKPYISQEKLDLCETCANKVLKIKGVGAQGYNEYTIREVQS